MKARTGSGIACALGMLGGVLIGGRAVKTYDWRTEWTIPAPMPVVYNLPANAIGLSARTRR